MLKNAELYCIDDDVEMKFHNKYIDQQIVKAPIHKKKATTQQMLPLP
jgi:ribosomal 50S subunit-recycling heat shock protein